MSKVVIAGDASGTGTFTISAPNSNVDRVLSLPDEAGTVLTTAGVPASAMPAGSVLQVVQTVKTDTFSTTLGTWDDITGLSVSITPTSNLSKILVSYNVLTSASTGAYTSALRVVRDATPIALGTPSGLVEGSTTAMGTGNSFSDYPIYTQSTQFLDSPSATTSLTYKIQIKEGNTGQVVWVNKHLVETNSAIFTRSISTITVMEIAG